MGGNGSIPNSQIGMKKLEQGGQSMKGKGEKGVRGKRGQNYFPLAKQKGK